jgi:hypothetical protein
MVGTSKKARGKRKVTPATSPDVWTITGTSQAWHLGRMKAARDTIDELAAAITTSEADNDTHRRVRRVIDQLNEQSTKEWLAYVDVASSNEFEREVMVKKGMPDRVELDDIDQVVQAMFEGSSDKRQESWGVFQVHAEQDRTGQPFNLTTPFREVKLSVFPADTQFIRINDHRHAATAALLEIFEMIRRDIRGFSKGFNYPQVWQRMTYQASFYQKAVRASAKTLPADEFRSWEPKLPATVDIRQAPHIVAELAGTARAQQILALHVVARFLMYKIAECERELPDEREPAWVDRTLMAIEEAYKIMDEAIAGYNAALMTHYGIPAAEFTPHTILRPIPRDLPMVAVMPIGGGATSVLLAARPAG